MTQTPEPQYYPDDEIDLRELFATLWTGKWWIIASTVIFAVAGVFYALSKPDIYQASALLAPAQGQEAGSRIGGQLSGLASLAGVSLGGGNANKTTIAKEVLQSRAFLTEFIHRHNLSEELMAAEAWNKSQEEWVYNREVYNPATGEWGRDDEGKSLSPVAARQWVEWLVHDVNEHMRAQDVQEAEASIDYLESKLQETNIAGMQQVFYQLIENETRTVMLANAQQEYVFKTVDPAVVPQEKSEPKRALICIVATLIGGMLGVLIVFVRAFIRSDQSQPDK
jgi:LPS O-antigen subunit length determinant protein (WzzB/FepE family)